MKCTRCMEINADDVLFCRQCGFFVDHATTIDCENHSGKDAIGLCVICGKPVCNDCINMVEGRSYCDEAAHARVPATYAKLAGTISVFGADLVAKNLAANGIPALVFSQHRYAHFYRFTDDSPASIFVTKEMLDAAHRLVEDTDLTDFFYQYGIVL